MSRFSGPQYKGAGRDARRIRRDEAAVRRTAIQYPGTKMGRKARDGELDPSLYGSNGMRIAGAR